MTALTVQRELVRLGYPLPRSTKADGALDGKLGPETLRAAQQFAIDRRLVPLLRDNDLSRALKRGQLPPSLLERLLSAQPLVRGVDASKWQRTVDWQAARRAGVRFAYLKATQGERSVDAFFERNARGALEAGIVCGAYHFWSQRGDSGRQAEHFAATTRGVPLLLPPVLDVEGERVFSARETNARLAEQFRLMDAATGRQVAVYSSARIWREWALSVGEERLAWLVGWSEGAPSPRVEPWGRWWLWQTGYGAGLPGFEGDVDRNLMRPDDFDGLKGMAA